MYSFSLFNMLGNMPSLFKFVGQIAFRFNGMNSEFIDMQYICHTLAIPSY